MSLVPSGRVPLSAAASSVGVSARSVDVNQLPFSLFVEVQNDPNTANRAVASAAGWSATPLPGYDCSHGKLGDRGWESYCRVRSPQLTLGKDGVRSITDAFGKLASMHASPGLTGAMRIYVPQNQLDDRATTNLMKMIAANEDILFRLGQNGGAGRPLDHKVSGNYAVPISGAIGNLNTVSAFSNTLRSHTWAVNAETAGQWEFRWLDSTTDGSAVAANVQLLMGMVKAAIEGTGNWTEAHPVGTHYYQQVDRKRWNAFMNATVGSGPLRQKLEQMFRSAGGQLEKETLSPEARNAVGQLLKTGYSFRDDSNNVIQNIDGLSARIDAGQGAQVALPQGGLLSLSPEQISMFAFAETGSLNQLGEDVRAEVTAAAGLRERGVELVDARGTALSPTQAAVLSTQNGQVFAARADALVNGGRGLVPIGGGTNLRMAEVLALENPDANGAPQDLKLLSHAGEMAQAGYTFWGRADGPIGQSMGSASTGWRAQIGALLRGGELVLQQGGKHMDVRNAAELHDKVLLPMRLSGLSAEDRAAVEQARQLVDRGFSFGVDGSPPAQRGTVGFIDALTSDNLVVHTPQAPHPTPLPTREHLRTLVRIETNRDAELDAGTRRLLEVVRDLKDNHDYRFFNKRTEEELRSRSAPALTLSTPDHKLMMRSPHAHRKTRVTARALENILYFEQGQRERMDPQLRQCVEKAEALKNAGYKLEMKDIMHPDDNVWVEPTMPDLIATLEGDRRIAIVLADGKRSIGAGAAAFIQKADRRLNPQPRQFAAAGQAAGEEQPAAAAPAAAAGDGWLVNGGGNQ
jgi:hypothetical protein